MSTPLFDRDLQPGRPGRKQRGALANREGTVYRRGVDLSSWPGLALRPITAADEPLLRTIYASTRAEELGQTGWPPGQQAAFLRQQFDAQHEWYQTHFAAADFDLILERGEPVGRLYVYRQLHDLNVTDIALLPGYRGRGIGTFLMCQILAEATREGKRVTLHVEGFNPARTLYHRLGFQPVGEEGVYVEMHWNPPADNLAG